MQHDPDPYRIGHINNDLIEKGFPHIRVEDDGDYELFSVYLHGPNTKKTWLATIEYIENVETLIKGIVIGKNHPNPPTSYEELPFNPPRF